MGMMGNKGGVAIRFSMFGKSFCFVSVHLAAHRENVTARNLNAETIMSKLAFGMVIDPYSKQMKPSSQCETHHYFRINLLQLMRSV
jgi:hypothetical protein